MSSGGLVIMPAAVVVGAAAAVVLVVAAGAVLVVNAANAAGEEVLRARVGRRLAAHWLSALEDRSVTEAIAPSGPPPGLTGVAHRLRAVRAGAEDLDPRLRGEARQLLDWAAEAVRRRFSPGGDPTIETVAYAPKTHRERR